MRNKIFRDGPLIFLRGVRTGRIWEGNFLGHDFFLIFNLCMFFFSAVYAVKDVLEL